MSLNNHSPQELAMSRNPSFERQRPGSTQSANQLVLWVSVEGKAAGVWNYEGWNFNSGNYLFTTDTK